MKNIHVLPTDKPSRLVLNNQKELWFNPDFSCKSGLAHPQNIYITSDEEIKEGDWMIRGNEQPTLVTPNFFWDFGVRYYKIILTTDQDLIKDGVQAIDDEFLEWFVKNANESGVPFDRFEIEKNWNYPLDKSWEYKIIIPQEEPKQETLEEAAENYSKLYYASREPYLKEQYAAKLGFKDGAKWQAERMYNKEDTIDFAHFYFNVEFNSTMQDCKTSEEIWDLWVQQRKKK